MSTASSVINQAVSKPDWTRADTLTGGAVALFAGVILSELAGLELGLVRPVIVVPFLSLVPGYLLLGILRVEPSDTATMILYSLGLSLCFLMGYGVVLNTALPGLGIESVFRESVLFVAMLGGVCALLVVYSTRGDVSQVNIAGFAKEVWQPWPLALLCVPFFSIIGARTVTRFGNNEPMLAVLAGLGLLTIVAYSGKLPKEYFSLAIWVIAVSLLLHNSVLTHVLAWDAPKELRLATLVIENGIWDPTVGGKAMKNAMLRIVLVHPMYALLSDIDLLWEFKTVSPVLFSFAPVAFYKSYHAVVDRSDAFVAALLPMSLFSFFTVLSWNSRTNGALLFLSLVALVVTDRTLSRRSRRGFIGVFLFGLIVSHYATAYLVLGAMGLVLFGNWIFFGVERTTKQASTGLVVVLFFGLLVFVWYVFVVNNAGAFTRLIGELNTLFSDLWRDITGTQAVVSEEDSTTTQYVTTTYTSNTIRWLQSLNIVVGMLAGLSIATLGLYHLRRRIQEGVLGEDTPGASIEHVEYFLYAAAFLGVFGVTFVGISQLNTARTLMPALLFFAPFVTLTPRKAMEVLAERVDRSSLLTVGKALALVLVLGYFILNVGLYGAATGEYHPNILIDKERVTESGNFAEKKYFSAMFGSSVHDQRATEWIESDDRDGDTYRYYGSREVIRGMYNCTGLSRQPIVRQGSCDGQPAAAVGQMDKVYASAGSEVYYNQTVSSKIAAR